MEQLETKYYSRAEIAEITGLNIADNKHFKRNLETKLSNWGYLYNYDKKGVLITKKPEKPIEKFKEIMIRKYGMNANLDFYCLAWFIYLLAYDEIFLEAPWSKKTQLLKDYYISSVSETILKKWYKVLADNEIIFRLNNPDEDYWCTFYVEGIKETEKLTYDNYLELESLENYLEAKEEVLNSGLLYNSAMKLLWNNCRIVYYKVKKLEWNRFNEKYIEFIEVINLVYEIIKGE